jgi:hypothetical protein
VEQQGCGDHGFPGKDEVIGKDLVQVYITEEYRASVKEVLDNALQGNEAANFEFPLYTKVRSAWRCC